MPFRYYISFELEGCHPIQRVNILRSTVVKLDQVVMYPLMAPQELLRMYISLEPEDLKQGKREWNQKTTVGGDRHGGNPEDEFDLEISLA